MTITDSPGAPRVSAREAAAPVPAAERAPEFGVLVPPPGADDSHVVHGSTLAELTDQLRQRLVKYRAETGGAELAPDFTEQLAAAIARFNRLAADGVDVDFHRGEKPVQLMFNGAVAPSPNGPNPTMYLCVPRISSMALSSRVALPAVRP
jgi:hypothetical protein